MFKSNLSIAVFLAVVAAANWLAATHFMPEANTKIAADAVEDHWQLPNVQLGNDTIGLNSKLLEFHPWGVQEKTADAEKETAEEIQKPNYTWKLVGIVSEGRHQYALAIDGKTQKVERYQVDAELPDGSHLVAILANEVKVKQGKDGATQQVKLYEPIGVSSSSATPVASAPSANDKP